MIRAAVLLTLAAGTAAAAAPRGGGFPQDFWGRWGESRAGCSPGAVHGGITIERLSVRDGEFQGDVRKVVRRANGSIDVTENWADFDEGPTTFVSNYELSKDRTSLTVRTMPLPGEGPEIETLTRCEVAQ